MSTTVEEFSNKEDRDARLRVLRDKGHRPNKSTTSKATKWEMVYLLTYNPESKKRRVAIAVGQSEPK